MFRPIFVKLTLIILALVLTSCVSKQAQNSPCASCKTPVAIMCSAPGPGIAPGLITIPDGHQPTEFCPDSAITRRFYQSPAAAPWSLPIVAGVPIPSARQGTAEAQP
jgi:hypothetical protein